MSNANEFYLSVATLANKQEVQGEGGKLARVFFEFRL